jgi:GT2 family glycosyltransferase
VSADRLSPRFALGATDAFSDVNIAEPQVSICILTYNRCALVQQLLRQLSRLSYPDIELIVVDNHSQDGTDTMIRSEFPAVRHIRTERNLGAAGRNLAMKAAKGTIVVTLDDDVSGLNDADIHALVVLFDHRPEIGAVNFRVTNESGTICNWVHHCRVEDFEHRTFLTYEITEGAVAFRNTVLQQAGYYPDGFFLSHEGPDLAFRIFESGFMVIYTDTVSVSHAFAPAGREPWRNYYYDTRNQFWLAARNFPPAYAARYLGRGLLATLAYSVRDGYLRYWLKAVAHGLAGLREALASRKVLSQSTMQVLREIDAQRPSIAYLVKKRLFTRDGLLFK